MKIYGASDDLVEIEGHSDSGEVDCIEVGCYERDVIIIIGHTDVGLAVRMSYDRKIVPTSAGFGEVGFSCWSACIVQRAEGAPVPWPVTITTAPRHNGGVGYSVCVNIDIPAGTPLAYKVVKP